MKEEMVFLILGLASFAATIVGFAGGKHILRIIDEDESGVYVREVRMTEEDQKKEKRIQRRNTMRSAACKMCWIITVVSFFLTVIFFSKGIISEVISPKEVALFIQNKEYIEGHKSEAPIEDAAITQTKIEMNQWLFNAKYSKERWGWWSIYPEEVLNLTPIE